MADVHITKLAAAERQIVAAIRMLLAGEDPLAVHTVVAAAHGVLVNLDEKRAQPFLDEVYATALDKVLEKLQLRERISKDVIDQSLPEFKSWVQRIRRKPANFLKHADKDADKFLDAKTLETEHLLLEACTLLVELGLRVRPEMYAYGRWHLAVYPHEESDKMSTAVGFLHELPLDMRLQFGKVLVERLADQAELDQL